MQLTLGPVFYNWPPETWRDFYFRIADEAPIDIVAIGEVVCSKRAPFTAPHFDAVIERLLAAGKQVLLSSLALVVSPREARLTDELALCQASLRYVRRARASRAKADADGGLMAEANDVSVLRQIAGRPHTIGPFVNIYNERAAAVFTALGARRLCLPPELPAESISQIARASSDAVIEIFAFGRAPLAISARCYHARLHKLSKDNCQFVCETDPDGRVVDTLDGEHFLAVNGVQTLSYTCVNLAAETARLKSLGVGALRLSPQQCDMVAVARIFRDVLSGRLEAAAADSHLARIYPGAPFSNGFLHGAPGAAQVQN